MRLDDFLLHHGISERIIFDEKIHRFAFSGNKNKSGWYIAFDVDGYQAVVAGDFRIDEKWIWSSKGEGQYTPELKRKIDDAQKKAAQEKIDKQKKAQSKAIEIFESAKDQNLSERVANNEYLKKKQIKSLYGAKYIDNYIAIPVKDINGQITSLQKIYDNGDKRFLSGGKISGCYFGIGKPTDTIYLTEGFATAASIHEATGMATVCAFYASNLEPVYLNLKKKYPDKGIILAADNDAFKDKNTGREVAERLHTKYGMEARFPTFKDVTNKPTDFNDLMVQEGLDAVKNILNMQVNIIGDDAIEALTVIPKSELTELWNKIGISVTRQGQPIINESAVVKVMAYDNSLKIYYDEFLRNIMVENKGKPRPIEDHDYLDLLIYFQTTYGLSKLSLGMTRNAIDKCAHENCINSCKNYLTNLKWDGENRVENFFYNYCNTPDSEYTKAISKNWWVSMVARVLNSGCKVDNMVVLEGKQGALKSSMLDIIGGTWFAENTSSLTHKDFYQNLEGVLIMEIAELDSFSSAGVNTIKRVLSSRVDKYRPAFGRVSQNFPRQCVFVGTTNDREYLQDDTGGRRFWPIKCVHIHLEAIKTDRDQLFAEAVDMFKKGEKWWEVPDMAKTIQENRRLADPWEDKIIDFMKVSPEITKTDNIMDMLEIPIERRTKKESNRIGKILRSGGFKNRAKRNAIGDVVKCWVKEND